MSVENLRVQFLRRHRGENQSYVGADGELTVNTSDKTLHLHDGKKLGACHITRTTMALDATG